MLRFPIATVLVCVFTAAGGAWAADAQKQEIGGAVAVPIAAVWQYSSDGGKTFAAAAAPAEVPASKTPTFVARATFTVADPARIACLWLAFDGKDTRAAFGMGNLTDARGKYCGALPLWSYAKVTLNGKPITGPLERMVYHYLPVVPGDLLVQGENTLVVSGLLEAWGYSKTVPTKPLKLLAAAPQESAIRSGPVLGMFGDDFFTVTCRTSLPATVTVAATAAGKKTSATSPVGLNHRLKVPIAVGTRTFTYTVTSAAGTFKTSRGPFAVTLPDPKAFRFLAVGNTRCNRTSEGLSPYLLKQMLKTKPQLFMHVGQVVEIGTWDFNWDPYFFAKYDALVSTVPTYLAPDGGDHTGLLYKTFWTPAGENRNLTWTQVIGDVRFIGVDGAYDFSPESGNYKWLESVLKAATEKFVFVFNHFPGYSSGMMSRRKWHPLTQSRDVILPLLAKYKVNAMISAFDFNYQRCEVPAPKGVPCIIVGAGGSKRLNQSPTATRNNPFSGTGPFVYQHSFAIFDVSGDVCEMKAIDIAGKQIDARTFKAR